MLIRVIPALSLRQHGRGCARGYKLLLAAAGPGQETMDIDLAREAEVKN